jgi:hypothetical protein
MAWQPGFSYKLDPHSDTYLDEPFYNGFNKVEFQKKPDGTYSLTPDAKFIPFRWTTAQSEWLFPAVGQHDYQFKLTVAGSQNPHADFKVLVNGQLLAANEHAAPEIKTYEYAIPASLLDTGGDLRISLQVQAFTPAGDKRELGLAFFSAEILATGTTLTIPPFLQLGWLIALVLLVYLLLVRSGFGNWQAAAGTLVVLAVLAWVVIGGSRPWLTIFSQELVFAFGLAYPLVLLADLLLRCLWSDQTAPRWVLAIFIGAFAIRLAGLLHPQAAIVDIGFHVNRYNALWEQGKIFDKIQSAEWGGRYTVYPPTPYFFAGLLGWLISSKLLLLKVFMVGLDSSRILLIYILAQKTLRDRHAAILSAFFFATMPVGLLSIAWGQVSNLFGEWLLLSVLTLAVVKFEQLRRPIYFISTMLLLALSFVSHPGVLLLSGTVFLLIALLIARRKGQRTFALIYLVALAISFGTYHWQTVGDMVPQAIQTIQSKFAPDNSVKKVPDYQVGGSVRDDRLSQQYGLTVKIVHTRREMLLGGLSGFWAEARVYFNVLPLLAIPWFLWWLWYSSRITDASGEVVAKLEEKIAARQRRLFWAALAWLVTAGLFAMLGLVLNLYVRYSLFLLPIAALALALVLAKVWARVGGWGKFLTVTVSLYFLVNALALYYDRIVYALHPLH